jgi:hypothetical protein
MQAWYALMMEAGFGVSEFNSFVDDGWLYYGKGCLVACILYADAYWIGVYHDDMTFLYLDGWIAEQRERERERDNTIIERGLGLVLVT